MSAPAQRELLVDSETRALLAAQMAVTFPRPQRDPDPRRHSWSLWARPLMVYRQAVRVLSADALASFCIVAEWQLGDDEISLERLASWLAGDAERAKAAVGELRALGIFMTPEETDQVTRDRDRLAEEARGSEPGSSSDTRPQTKLVAPEPWPEYTDQTWRGARVDLTIRNCPPRGQAIVYFLYDGRKLLYVGSTGDAWIRLFGHGEKPWTRYTAHGCADQEAAYWLEAAEIVRRRPPLNRDRHVGGRAALVPTRDRQRRVEYL